MLSESVPAFIFIRKVRRVSEITFGTSKIVSLPPLVCYDAVLKDSNGRGVSLER